LTKRHICCNIYKLETIGRLRTTRPDSPVVRLRSRIFHLSNGVFQLGATLLLPRRSLLFAVALSLIALSVAPPAALALPTTFRVKVDWNGHPRDDAGVRLRLITRAHDGGAELDNRAMNFLRHTDGVSTFTATFNVNGEARVWEVEIQNVNAHFWAPASRVIPDREEIRFEQELFLDAAFICVDQ